MNRASPGRRSVTAVPPPVYFLLALILMGALHVLFPLALVIPGPLRRIGPILMLAGGALDVWAALLFRRAGTAIRPFQPALVLVGQGPYRFTRNPMYLGMVLLLIGLGFWLGSLAPFLVVPLFVALIHRRFILAEEAFMERAFGAAYARYRASVRRWL